MLNTTKILLYISIIAIFSSVLLFLAKLSNQKQVVQKEPTPKPTPIESPQTKISDIPHEFSTIVGIVRPSGLTYDQKTRMKLYSEHIVEFEPTVVLGTKYSFAYLGSGVTKDDLPRYTFGEGKCVVVEGAVDPESFDGSGIYNGEASLGGLVIQEFTAAPVDLDMCKKVISNVQTPPNANMIKVSGRIKRISRPSPDIAYDYMIESSTTIPGVFDMSGMGSELPRVVVMPKNFDIYKQMETTLGEEVSVSGYLQWGYAESQFFTIEEFY